MPVANKRNALEATIDSKPVRVQHWSAPFRPNGVCLAPNGSPPSVAESVRKQVLRRAPFATTMPLARHVRLSLASGQATWPAQCHPKYRRSLGPSRHPDARPKAARPHCVAPGRMLHACSLGHHRIIHRVMRPHTQPSKRPPALCGMVHLLSGDSAVAPHPPSDGDHCPGLISAPTLVFVLAPASGSGAKVPQLYQRTPSVARDACGVAKYPVHRCPKAMYDPRELTEVRVARDPSNSDGHPLFVFPRAAAILCCGSACHA